MNVLRIFFYRNNKSDWWCHSFSHTSSVPIATNNTRLLPFCVHLYRVSPCLHVIVYICFVSSLRSLGVCFGSPLSHTLVLKSLQSFDLWFFNVTIKLTPSLRPGENATLMKALKRGSGQNIILLFLPEEILSTAWGFVPYLQHTHTHGFSVMTLICEKADLQRRSCPPVTDPGWTS